MPEPLIHFIIPFFLLIMVGITFKRSVLISLLAILPDFDVIFGIHRSISHSVIFLLALIVGIILLLNYLKIGDNRYYLLAILVLLSHPFLDMFGGLTPIFWPLYDKSINIVTELNTNLNNVLDLNFIFRIEFEKTIFYKVNGEGPIFTSEAFGITLVLLAGLAMKNLSSGINKINSIIGYGIILIEKVFKK